MTAPERRRALWWRAAPGWLAGATCVACCAAPMLVAAGVISGAGAAGVLLGWLPTVAIVLVVVAVVAFVLPVRAQRHRGRCAGAAGCGCSPNADDLIGSRSTLAL